MLYFKKVVQLLFMSKKFVYIFELPSWVGSFQPFSVNNSSLENFEGCFQIHMPISFTLQSGMFGGEVEADLVFDGSEVSSPNLLVEKLPFLPKLNRAIEYAECALKGELDFMGFKQSIDSLSLPISLRDALINQLFESAPYNTGPSTMSKPQSENGNGLSKILTQMDLGSEKTEPKLAAEQFVEAAAEDNTGFIIKKDTGEDFLNDLKNLTKEVRRQLLASPQLCAIFDLFLSLYTLSKACRSRNKQHLYVIPEGGLKEGMATELNGVFGDFHVECVVIYGGDAMPETSTLLNWETQCSMLESPLFLNWKIDSLETIDKLAEIQTASNYSRTYVFGGYVAINLQYRGNQLIGWKPSHVSFCEGLIRNMEDGWMVQGEYYRLEDQGVLVQKGRTYVTQEVYSEDEWRLWVEQGVNMVNSQWNSDVALFKPLVPLAGNKFY